nr:hypothetical protein [Moorena sp. SIO4A1]
MKPNTINRILSQKDLPKLTCKNTPSGGRKMAQMIRMKYIIVVPRLLLLVNSLVISSESGIS